MLWLILVLYLVSFLLPVISESAPHSEYGPNFSGTLGWQVFVSLAAVMWIPLFGLPALVWLANPFFWIGCFLYWRGRWRATVIWGILSLALALMAEAIFAYVVIGYFVWLASIVLLTANGLSRWMADGPRISSDSRPRRHRPLWTQGALPYFLGAVFGLAVLLLACGLSALNTPAKSEGRPISDLLSEARSPDPSIRRDAVESLGLRIWRGQRPDVLALAELLTALKDPDESVRSCADMSLESTRLRHLQREEIPVVQAELKNPDKRVRHKAAEVLFEAPAVLYSKDVEHLITTLKISALKDDDPYVRQTAARWMSYGCVPEDLEPAKAALTAVLEDRDEQVRRWAASSLEELKKVRY
jgi:hypothetical protein